MVKGGWLLFRFLLVGVIVVAVVYLLNQGSELFTGQSLGDTLLDQSSAIADLQQDNAALQADNDRLQEELGGGLDTSFFFLLVASLLILGFFSLQQYQRDQGFNASFDSMFRAAKKHLEDFHKWLPADDDRSLLVPEDMRWSRCYTETGQVADNEAAYWMYFGFVNYVPVGSMYPHKEYCVTVAIKSNNGDKPRILPGYTPLMVRELDKARTERTLQTDERLAVLLRGEEQEYGAYRQARARQLAEEGI